MPMTNPPQNGAVTHHHDQSITLHSFNTMNATPNNPRTPIPLDELLLLFSFLMLFMFLFTILCHKQSIHILML